MFDGKKVSGFKGDEFVEVDQTVEKDAYLDIVFFEL